MNNYIIKRGNIFEHYFSEKSGGVYSHKLVNGAWTMPKSVSPDISTDFGLFSDTHGCVHIVGASSGGAVVYTLIRGEYVSHHTLLECKPSVVPKSFFITSVRGFLNMFYTAQIGNEKTLVHCILGNNAQPSVVSHICDEHFFVHGGRVYFSNENSVLGYCDFSDGKPSDFVPLIENAVCPYIFGSASDYHTVWLKDGFAVLDGEVINKSAGAQIPVIVSSSPLTVMWKQGAVVYYTAQTKNTMSPPMRFISPGREAELFCMQTEDGFSYMYGTYSQTSVNIFGKTDVFSSAREAVYSGDDFKEIKESLLRIQNETEQIRRCLENVRRRGLR